MQLLCIFIEFYHVLSPFFDVLRAFTHSIMHVYVHA